MKILIVQESDWLKRNMHQQHHLAELMSIKGHEIRVIDFPITWRDDGDSRFWVGRRVYPAVQKIYPGAKVTVIRPGIIQKPLLDYASMLWTHSKEIAKQMGEFKPDVVIGFGIVNSWLACQMRGRTPFVYYWIDVLHELIPIAPLRILGKWIEQATLNRATVTLTINKNLKAYMERISHTQVALLGPGVDINHFNRVTCNFKRPAIRERYGIKEDDILLFFMGWLYTFSGLAEVVNEMRKINCDPRFKLLIAGDGDDYDHLTAIRDNWSLQKKVFLPGKVDYAEIPAHIAASDVCILPSYPDYRVMKHIVPIKIYEYMAMAKPVIATRLPAVVAEFGDELIYVDKPEDIIHAVQDLVVQDLVVQDRDMTMPESWDSIANRFEWFLKVHARKW